MTAIVKWATGVVVDQTKDAFTKPPNPKFSDWARMVAGNAKLLKMSKLTQEEWLELAAIMDGGAATQARRDYFKARL